MHGFVAFGCVLRVTTVLLVVSGFASVVLGQHSSGGCPSEVRVPAGSSTVVDCVPGADFRGKRYRWTSPDPSWLEYLSDAAAASPRFHAPVDAEMPYHVAYPAFPRADTVMMSDIVRACPKIQLLVGLACFYTHLCHFP